LSLGFASFIYNGGTVRIVANHILSKQDKEAILAADNGDFDSSIIDLTDIKSLVSNLDEYGTHFFNCISYLIAKKRIELVFVSPKEGQGISHYKYVKYLDPTDIEIAIQDGFNGKNIDELLVDEQYLLKAKSTLNENPYLAKAISDQEILIEKIHNSPKFPYPSGPRDYQIKAYQKWVENDKKGLFAMATGTGKTITSLNCLLNEYKDFGMYRAIITVPTTALVEQWKKECTKFNFKNIISVSSKENWDQNLAFFNTASKLIDTSYIVIVTYASLPRQRFQSYFTQLPKDTILIADETHNLGSQGLLRLLPNIHLEKRIGLSATPHRKFDEAGNQAIQDFFNDEPPYIVSYSMKEALNIGWLCKYTYHPHIVHLTDQEMEKYKELSLQLLRMGLFDKETGAFRSTPEIEKKLLERKRIIHKATNKLGVFESILRSEFDKRKNLKYTLIYVPEGVEAKYDETDFSVETEDEKRLINKYTKAVSQTDESIMVKQFTANSTNREQILKNFEESNIHVLTSMKCLDEGVDVARSELAIFCASTGNPRQFIQRRGRVLRLHKNKIHATIHDLVVVPQVASESTYDMEKGLVKKEFERVVDFATLAMNKTDTYEATKNILDYYNLNLNDL